MRWFAQARSLAIVCLAVAALAIIACRASSDRTGPTLRSDLPLLGVNSGQIGPPHGSAIARVYKSPDELPPNAGQWLLAADAVDFSLVDWRRQDVVTVSLGRKPTAGYGVRIDRIAATDWGLEVYVTEFAPPRGAQVAQVVTHPWAAALVYKTDNTVISKLHITPARQN